MSLRPPRDGDVPTINALFNEVSEALHGVRDSSEGEVRNWLETPSVDPERDVRLAEGPDGELSGYADVYLEEEHKRGWFDLRLHPERADGDLANAFVDWIHERIPTELVTRGWIAEQATLAGDVLRRRGYEVVRHSYRMTIDLDDATDDPAWPAGLSVRTMRAGEERLVYDVNEECFADHWEHAPVPFEEWMHWMSDREEYDLTLWFLAVEGDEVAGLSLCRRHDAEHDLGWIDSLGVRRPWRRRGLGRALLLHSFQEFRTRGWARAGLGVDAQSLTGANKLYESAGMSVERRWDVYQRPS